MTYWHSLVFNRRQIDKTTIVRFRVFGRFVVVARRKVNLRTHADVPRSNFDSQRHASRHGFGLGRPQGPGQPPPLIFLNLNAAFGDPWTLAAPHMREKPDG